MEKIKGDKIMENIIYRKLKLNQCDLINQINPTQYIKNAWRKVDRELKLVEIDYLSNDWANGYDEHYNSLKNTIINGGYAFGVFNENNKLLGFATINREVFGNKYKHVLLDQMFISLEYRNKGIGKKLFTLCADAAKSWNVDKIYICAGSAEETIAFYFAIGCKYAEEINKELYEDDPRDLQLEYIL